MILSIELQTEKQGQLLVAFLKKNISYFEKTISIVGEEDEN